MPRQAGTRQSGYLSEECLLDSVRRCRFLPGQISLLPVRGRIRSGQINLLTVRGRVRSGQINLLPGGAASSGWEAGQPAS